MQLSKIQKEAVERIVNYYIDEESIIDFKAPTGSGKTFMAANIISKILQINKIHNKKTIFLIATLSSSELPKQMVANLNKYKNFLTNGKDLDVEWVESPSATTKRIKDKNYYLKPEDGKIYVVGKSSFGKNRIFTEQSVFEIFVDSLQSDQYSFIYIRDEAHWGIKKENLNEDEKKFESLIQKAADFTLFMTATPKSNNKKVIIEEKDLEKDNLKLVKKIPLFNLGLDNFNSEIIGDLDLLQIAIDNFQKIKKSYSEVGSLINPAMLIQVSNSNNIDKTKQEDFNKNIDKILKKLSENNLTWVKYFGANDVVNSDLRYKPSLQDISENNSEIDVIIFKIGPSTGWNIPRACMLVGLRSVFSETLNQQILGRIKRYPNPYKDESIYDNYYVYSNYQEKTRSLIQYKLKNEYKDETFFYGKIKHKDKDLPKNNQQKYQEEIINLILENLENIELEIKNCQKEIELESFNFKDLVFGKNREIKKHDLNPINNSILLAIAVIQELKNKKSYLNKTWIENKIIEKYTKYKNQNWYFFWYVILKKFFSKIKKIYTTYEKNIIDNFEYAIELSQPGESLPENVNFWEYNNESNVLYLDKKNERIFLKSIYEQILDSKKTMNAKIVLDSKPEIEFLKKTIVDVFNKKENANFWVRNTRFNSKGVYFEYYDNDEKVIKKSYPDFLIKLSNNIFHIFEIKGQGNNDINKHKTEQIKEAFKKYNLAKINTTNFTSQNNNEIKFFIANINVTNYVESEFNTLDENEKIENNENYIFNLIK